MSEGQDPLPALVDEKAKKDSGASSSTTDPPGSGGANRWEGSGNATTTPPVRPLNQHSTAPATSSPLASPPQSPPISPPPGEGHHRGSSNEDYLGNQVPDKRAMSSVFGTSKIRLPGDLGARDPRRPKSPAPSSLPGDLGPSDPRRASSRPTSSAGSPAPSAASGHTRNASDEVATRLQEDPPEPGKLREDSDSEYVAEPDNDNDTDADDNKRGRAMKRPIPGRTTSGKAINVREDSSDSEPEEEQEQTQSQPAKDKPDPTKGQSKLSFAKDKRKERLTSASPSGRRRVHPSTAYNASGSNTPLHSDDESAVEMRAAQKLSLSLSGIHSTPSAHRVIRQILRGDFEHFQREAEEGRKRQRMYLVATDKSPEAEYALEWTIGTVLRDGDTLFAVYAADEDTVGDDGGVELGHGAESVRDTASILKAMPTVIQPQSNTAGPSPLARTSLGGSGDARSRSRGIHTSADTERRKAVETITERCVRLLRKTRLQVRVVVEVFHCKSPRHMVTEVIDFLSPTLVIIGSRGQSAMKGVLLGSFSNYLVTKSSVPVMVARKKLRKPSKNAKKFYKDGLEIAHQNIGRGGRFSNVIQAPKGKGLRVESWDKVGID